MTPVAIVMMIITCLIVWGGLAVAITNLMTHPDPEDDD